MPKIEGTKVQLLKEMFTKQNTLTAEEISLKFPTSNHAALVWYLKYRQGMMITSKKNGKSIEKYEYDPTVTGVVIDGSKKAHDARAALKDKQ